MWAKVLLVIMGVSSLWGAYIAIFSRRPLTVIRSQKMADGTIVKTEQLRPLRWWERLLFSLFGPLGVWLCVIAVVPGSRLAEVTTTVVLRFYGVVITVGLSAALVWSAGWLVYRRVLRRAPASRSVRPSAVPGAPTSITSAATVFDLADKAADRAAVGSIFVRLLRVLASRRGTAFVLAAVAGVFGFYVLALVPAVISGDYNEVVAIFAYFWLAAAIAEVLVLIVLPVLMVVALIAAVAKRAWSDVGELSVGVTIIAAGFAVAWRNGAFLPLLELLRKLPLSFQP